MVPVRKGRPDHVVHRWKDAKLGDIVHLRLEKSRLITVMKQWKAFPHVDGHDCGKGKRVVRDHKGVPVPAHYCSSPFHLYRLPSGRAFHVGKHEKMLYELETLEVSLGESIAKLKLELGKVREHNNTLVDGGTMLFGPEATKAKEGGVFIVDTGAGIPPNGLLMVTGQIEEILEVWSVGHKRDCKFNIFLTSYKGGQPARASGKAVMVTPSAAAAACSWALEHGEDMLGTPPGSEQAFDGSMATTPHSESAISWATDDFGLNPVLAQLEGRRAAEAPLEVSRWGVGGVASEQSKQQSAAFEGTLGGLSSKALEEHSRWSVRDGDGRHRVEHGDGLLKALMTSLQDEDTAAVYLIVSQNAPCPRQGSISILQATHEWRQTRRIPIHTCVLAHKSPPIDYGGDMDAKLGVLGRGPGGLCIDSVGEMVQLMRELSADSGGRFCWVDVDGIRQRTEEVDEGPILNALEALQLELADVAAFTTSYRKSLDGRDKYFYYHKARDKPKRNLTEDNLKLKRLLELKSYYHENKEEQDEDGPTSCDPPEWNEKSIPKSKVKREPRPHHQGLEVWYQPKKYWPKLSSGKHAARRQQLKKRLSSPPKSPPRAHAHPMASRVSTSKATSLSGMQPNPQTRPSTSGTDSQTHNVANSTPEDLLTLDEVSSSDDERFHTGSDAADGLSSSPPGEHVRRESSARARLIGVPRLPIHDAITSERETGDD